MMKKKIYFFVIFFYENFEQTLVLMEILQKNKLVSKQESYLKVKEIISNQKNLKLLKDQLWFINKIRSKFLSEIFNSELRKVNIIKVYDSIRKFRTYLTDEQTEIKAQYGNKMISAESYKILNSSIINGLKKLHKYLKINSRLTKNIDLAQYFSPAFWRKKNQNFNSLLNCLLDYRVTKYYFEDSEIKDILIKQLKEYNDLVKIHEINYWLKTDTFDFWKNKISTWRELSFLVIGILSIPTSSAEVERSFSIVKNFLGDRKGKYKTENLEKHLFLKLNNSIKLCK